MIPLIIAAICGVISAAIAHSKGRNAVGWFFGGFFLGIIGIVIVACISNLNEQRARQRYMENESRRLREQLRQERLKGESYRQYSMNRLDAHDEALGLDTRSGNLLDGPAGPTGLLTDANNQGFAKQSAQTAPASDALWYYERSGDTIGPVSEVAIRELLTSGTISSSNLVWTEGFSDWRPLADVDTFRLPGGL